MISTVDISVTNLCNIKCPQCKRTDPNGLKAHKSLPLTSWTLEEFQIAFPIEDLDNTGEYSFCGLWGDPLMAKDIKKIIYYIIDNSKKCKVSITTNGSIRKEDFYEEIGNYCGKRLIIIFDIDGINEEMHTKYRRGASLKKSLSNMYALSKTNAFPLSQTIIFKHNQDYKKEILTLAKKWGSRNHEFCLSDRFDNGESKWYFINEKGENEYLEVATDNTVQIAVDKYIKND